MYGQLAPEKVDILAQKMKERVSRTFNMPQCFGERLVLALVFLLVLVLVDFDLNIYYGGAVR